MSLYRSRSDLAVLQLPNPLPDFGEGLGSNSIFTDPDFGNRTVRITDSAIDPLIPGNSYTTDAGGSAEVNVWNRDSSMLRVAGLRGGRTYFLKFDPATMQASLLGPRLTGQIEWSRLSATTFYQFLDGQLFRHVNFLPQLLFDFATCFPAGFDPTWQSPGGVSASDQTFAVGLSDAGGQGTGIYVAVFRPNRGWRLLNTQIGEVTGSFGVQGAINIPDRFTIHNCKLSKLGDYVVIAPQKQLIGTPNSGPYFWHLASNIVTSAGAVKRGGHWSTVVVGGVEYFVNEVNSPLGQYAKRQMASPAAATDIIPAALLPSGIEIPLDQHSSAADGVLFATTTSQGKHPVFPTAWYDEIIGIAMDGSAVWRFGHTFDLGTSPYFTEAQAIGSVDQQRKFFAFSSDAMGTLGTDAAGNQRGDVFVVELR